MVVSFGFFEGNIIDFDSSINDKKKKNPPAKDRVDEPGMKIQTIDTSKGLQYKAVIMMWADMLPSGWATSEEEEERRKVYVGLTRAQRYLAITHTGDSLFTNILRDSWIFLW